MPAVLHEKAANSKGTENTVEFKDFINKKEFILLDGAMGTMIQKSGADVIYSNTFGANAYKLKDSGYSVKQVISAAINNAKNAVKGTDTLIALDIGPIGQLLEPAGALSFDEAYKYYKEQIIAGKDADIIVFETMTDLYELKAAVLAAKENCSKPIIATMTFERSGRTFTGASAASAAVTLDGLGADALGVNCSLGPDELEPIVSEISKYTDLPIVIKPNAGLPDPNSNEYNILPDDFAKSVLTLLKYGVKIVGGCCGTTPEYIAKIKVKNITRRKKLLTQQFAVQARQLK